ncbi:unnamed protein product [Chilo suppressalis]|uniref:WD repeat-containing protein 55 homolog n=1 Tax=Chilo suppressalis TaxID=168631 RepID=A0ABN8BJ75_CHISP|nr:hypothetical protein evm_001180 [Chilo suppressalis]CAH0407442.1 unnamed protein product [Chilo suppressalis]
MKRKISSLDDQEARLSQLLFSKSKNLVEKLIPLENIDHNEDLKPVWEDEDDLQYNIKNVNSSTNAARLKQKFENLVGTPAWAKINIQKSNNEEEEDSEILRTVGHIKKKKNVQLPTDYLEVKVLPHINKETHNEGRIISCIEFHPKLSVALVGGTAGTVSIISIGGDVNNKLHSFKLQKWKTHAAQFTPSGSEAYLATNLSNSYCVYDLVKAQPRLYQLPQVSKAPKLFQLSPDGCYIAVSDGFDEVFLISAASKELLRCLKHNSIIESLTFNHNSEQLYCYDAQGVITIWDLSTFRPIKKFYDNGCVKASCITNSPCGRLLATGSCEGIINIYDVSKLDTTEPLPITTISNLTTKISNLKFNATTEILAACSELIPNAVKLVHIPSYHVFANFPDQSAKLSKITTVNFSPNSGYMTIGNDKGCAKLYRLKYYKNY